jgi:hypothetical protein
MRTHTSALDLYNAQVKSFQASARSARFQWRQIPEGGYRDLKELTSGGISSKTLARMGHPYARLKGKASAGRRGVSKSYIKKAGLKASSGLAPLLPINRQSERLHRSVTLWHRSSRYVLEESVGFNAQKAGRSMYAVRPTGTRYVVPRGIWVELRKRGMVRNRSFRDVFLKTQQQAFAS